MKRNFSVLLALLLLSSAASACGDSGNTIAPSETPNTADAIETTVETEEPEDEYLLSLGEKDFGGADYTMIVTDQGALLNPTRTTLTGEALNDALYNRDREIEDKYNVKIQYPEYADDPSTAVSIANSVLAGDFICDAYIDALSGGSTYMGYTYQKGVLYNLLDVPYLQLDKAWWSSLMYKQLIFNHKMFFTSGDITGYTYAAPACAFINLQVADDYDVNVDTIYQLVYDGKWTIDELYLRTQGLHRDINGDGNFTPDTDFYGVVSNCISLTAEELLVGAGVELSGIDENGQLYIDLNTERVINVIDLLRRTFCENTPKDDANVILYDCFMNDRALFCVHLMESAINHYRDMKSDYSILPMPKYDEAQKSYMSYINPHSHSFIAIPLTLENPEKTGFITEVMEYMTVKDVRRTIYDVTLKGKVARNPDSGAMLDIIYSTTYTDLNAIMNFGTTIDQLSNAIFNGKDITSLLEKSKNSVAKGIEKIMKLYADDEE